MNQRTKTGLEILQVALILGVLGDVLLRQTPWGLNVLLFNAAFAAGMIMLIRRGAHEQLTGHSLGLLGALVFFASMFVWRDAIELRVADTFAIIAILAALFLPKMNVAARAAGVIHYIIAFLWSGINAIFAPFALVGSDVSWSNVSSAGWQRHIGSVLRGVALAAPLVLIFGALFMAADAAFEGLVQQVFDIVPETVISHVMIFAAFAWLSAGYLRGVVIRPLGAFKEAQAEADHAPVQPEDESKVDALRAESGEHPVTLPDNLSVVEHINISDPPDEPTAASKPAWQWSTIDNSLLPNAFTLGAVEVGIILGLMNLLFLGFVIIQVPYLFGGMELVRNTPDFKLAEYARRGFGELVAVSALVLPTLLIGHWLIRKDNSFAHKLFRALAGLQVVLLFVIMASAVQRLLLLTGSLGYGLTTVRLYPMIVMTWLAIVFVWFAGTVLRGARQYFAIGALWSALCVLGATHVLNPDAFIVSTNIALMHEGRSFDADYNARLSDDALPAMLNVLPALDAENGCAAKMVLYRRLLSSRDELDLRSWNISRSRARRLLEEDASLLEEQGECTAQAWTRTGE